MWLRDTGILDKIKNDVMNPPIPIPAPRVRINQPLILRQLGIIMITLIVGLFLATISFLVEIFVEHTKKPNASKPVVEIDITMDQYENWNLKPYPLTLPGAVRRPAWTVSSYNNGPSAKRTTIH